MSAADAPTPRHVAVVIDAHHRAATHAQPRQDQRQPIEPDIRDADLDLRRPVRRLDYRGEPYPPLLHDRTDIDSPHTEAALRHDGVRPRLLAIGIHLHQHDLVRVVRANNRTPHERVVAGVIEAADESTELPREPP